MIDGIRTIFGPKMQRCLIDVLAFIDMHPVCDAAESSVVGKNTAIYVYQWLREVCSTQLWASEVGRLGRDSPN